VESEPAKGTAVSVYLPRIANRASVEKAGPVEFLPVGHEHILFIDDEPTLVDMAKEMLDYLGYKVTTSSNSLDALKLFREQPDRFDLVITDLSMPNMTGDRLSKEIVRTRPDIPVILCTGYSETLTEEKTRFMGIQEYAMKPLVLNDMAVIIRKALDKTRPR
jgi:DNA-binding NtrC family response regulator